MNESSTVYACCRACNGVVGVVVVNGAVADAMARVMKAGLRPYVTGPGAKTHYLPGYQVSASCRQSHQFEVPV